MKYGILFATVAVLLASSAVTYGGWGYILCWPALSFGIVALGYFCLGPCVYGKSQRGILSPLNQLLLFPYLLYLWFVWYAIRLVQRESAFDQLTENIFIGRRLLSHELRGNIRDNIDHVIDLTCEFSEAKALRSISYHSFPILDGSAPSPDQLCQWTARAAALSGNIYIHCAEGHGRTGLFTAVLLLHTGYAQTPKEALHFIQSKRPLVCLSQRQQAVLNRIHDAAKKA